ncbi:hypothetical protein PQX77_017639 [Marasmius sp. AFHP31]|nr:hypothetical protein PQX77_017639 [Marasmius sp. AFHP31]
MSAGAAVTESSRHTSIAQGVTITTIHGNQINNVIQPEKKEPTEFDDFRIVKRGDICRYRDVVQFQYAYERRHLWCTRNCQCESCQQQRVVKTVCIGKIEGTRGKFTVMSYSGPGGRKAFEKDFRTFSSIVTSKVPQMYAVDIGSIPSIVYWNELAPAVVLKGNLGWLGQMYLYSLCCQWVCEEGELWIDLKRGVICRGPEGPYPGFPGRWFETDDMPLTVDLLQDDICMRFMASCRSEDVDRAFIEEIRSAGDDVGMPESFDQPTIISALTQTPIAVGNNVWESDEGNLIEKKVLGNGVTRFRADGGGQFCLGLDDDVNKAWLCQALRVFHAHESSLDNNTSVYHLIWCRAELESCLSYNQIHLHQRSQQPVYLFIRPPPPNQPSGNTSSLHFWSLHADGEKPLSSEICDDFGLPTTLKYKNNGYESISWSTKIYRLMDEYQRLRGFDPKTMDFAQYLGYDGNLFHPVNSTNCFDEDCDDQHIECPKSPPNLDGDQSNGDNNSGYPAIQKQRNIGKFSNPLVNQVGEPTSMHIITTGRANAGDKRTHCRDYTEQNFGLRNNGTRDEHTGVEPCPQRIPPFNVFPGNVTPARMTFRTENTAREYLEMPQHAVLAAPSHSEAPHWREWNPYARTETANTPPRSTPIMTNTSSARPNTHAIGDSNHTSGEYTSRTVEWPELSQLGDANRYHTWPPKASTMGGLSRMSQTVHHAYHPAPSDVSRNNTTMIDDYNLGYQTDAGVNDMARDIGTGSEYDREVHFDRFISGIWDNHLTYAREVGPMVALQATDSHIYRPHPSSCQLDVDELCIWFERLAIV